jgi:GTP-binding protein HflX
MKAVRDVLEEVEASEVPQVLVLNKVDRLAPEELDRLRVADPDALLLSAKSGEGREALLDAVARALALDACRVTLDLDASSEADRALVARLYREGRVLAHDLDGGRLRLQAEVSRRLLDRLPLPAAAATRGPSE